MMELPLPDLHFAASRAEPEGFLGWMENHNG